MKTVTYKNLIYTDDFNIYSARENTLKYSKPKITFRIR